MAIIDVYDYYITDEDFARAAQYGVSRSLLSERVRRLCWPKEKAITTPPAPKRSLIPQIVRDLAEQNGIPFKLLSQRIHAYGWSLYKAATQPKGSSKSKNLGKFIKPRDPYADLAERNGIKRDTYFKRVNDLGWDCLSAATIPTGTKRPGTEAHPWRNQNKLVFRKFS